MNDTRDQSRPATLRRSIGHSHRRFVSVFRACVAACAGLVTLCITAPATNAVPDPVNFFLSAPGVQGSFLAGTSVETFDDPSKFSSLSSQTFTSSNAPALSVGTVVAGTFTVTTVSVGGASTTTSTATPYGSTGSRFTMVPSNNSMTVDLGSNLNYLGFWWASGDAGSTIEMYDGSTMVGTFSTSNITSIIPKGTGKTVTAYGGAVYTNNEYYGARGQAAPTPTQLNSYIEPFAFVHAVAPTGLTFNKIKFIQGPSGGFELDNLTVGNYTDSFDATGLVGFGLANDVAVDDSFTMAARGTLTGTLASNDTFVGSSAFSKDTSPSLGTATVATSGVLTFAAGDSTGSTSFTYKLCRTISTCVSATVTITITGPTSVAFDPNLGSGTMATQSATSATALTSNLFTRSGYVFAGWNTAADGKGVSYADGASYPFDKYVTLYAQWTSDGSSTTVAPTSTVASSTTLAGAASSDGKEVSSSSAPDLPGSGRPIDTIAIFGMVAILLGQLVRNLNNEKTASDRR